MQPGAQASDSGFRLPELSQDGLGHRLRVPGDWRRPQAGGHYDLWWRETDGYGAILPRPDASEIGAFYRLEDYYTHHSAKAGQDRQSLAWRILLHLAWRRDRGVELDDAQLAEVLGTRPLDLLEIGCGGGEMLRRLVALGHRVSGFDPDPAALVQAGAASPGVSLYEGTAEAFPPALAAERFDGILMLHVLEHCLDPLQALRNSYAALRPGGRIIIEVPNNEAAGLDVYGPAWFWLDVPRHLNFFSGRSLSAMAEAAGLVVERLDYTGYARQFTADWREAHERIGQTFGRSGMGSFAKAAKLLARSLFARPEKRYDSLRIVAHRPTEGA